MVNKDVLFQNFMKLESYDKINIMSNILKFSNCIELEFYSSIIESILHYQKLSFDTIKEELNHDDNILFLKNTECIDSSIRSKLISTLSLLKVSNFNGAAQIFEFLRKNYHKFKELAQSNPNTYEEILLIYQLANDHPAFNFNHCQEIYDYLTEIKAVPLVINYSEMKINDETINDLHVVSIEKNDQQQYIYKIKVEWSGSECCITRTLEDVYKFYSRLYEMFTAETKNGEICALYLSYLPDNLDLSKTLMSKFLKDFLNSPQHVLHCDYVRQFFKPRITDKHVCDCDSCQIHFNKLYWSQDQRFDNISNCSTPNNPSDNEDYTQSFDNKRGMLYSRFNFSTDSKSRKSNLPMDVSIGNQISSDDGSELSLKTNRNINRTFHSSGSSPINTPSDESEICTKNEMSKHHSNEIYRQLNKEIKKNDINPSAKDLRTEKWLSQTSNSTNDQSKGVLNIQTYSTKSELESMDQSNQFQEPFDCQQYMSKFYNYQIGNMLEWLKQTRLHKYHSFIKDMNFGEFHILTEETLNNLGFVDGASKKLISLIHNLKPTDISVVADNVINLVSRNRSNSNDSSRSIYGSCGDISLQKSDLFYEYNGNKVMEQNSPAILGMLPPFLYQPYMSMPNLIVLSPNIISGSHIFSAAPEKQLVNQSSVNYW